MLHAGEVLQGRYQIIKVIGKGGMSTVYQARDLTNQNLLAIKDVERSGREDNQVVEQSLAGEGRMLKQLSNPHLPKIYDIIENATNFMLVMDYIEGESLDKVIAREGAQSVDQVLYWGMQICEVFDYLHNQNPPIIYRDMKPANLMLRQDGTLMMIDFGTARTQKDNIIMAQDTTCIGTAGFAAPEQYGGSGQSTARTDIFCLGATLYNMVTGHSPSERPVGILPLKQWNPALEGTPIAEIIYKCTRNDPNERYQTAMELYQELYLASTGAFRSSSNTKAGPLSGGLRKAEWQKQSFSGTGMLSSALAGKLQRGRTGTTAFEQAQPVQTAETAQEQPVWQAAAATVPEQIPETAEAVPQENVPDDGNEVWHKLTLIGALVALIFLILSVVLVIANQMTAGIVFMMIGLGSAVLALIGLVQSRKSS